MVVGAATATAMVGLGTAAPTLVGLGTASLVIGLVALIGLGIGLVVVGSLRIRLYCRERALRRAVAELGDGLHLKRRPNR